MHDVRYDVEPSYQLLEGKNFYSNSTTTGNTTRLDNKTKCLGGSEKAERNRLLTKSGLKKPRQAKNVTGQLRN